MIAYLDCFSQVESMTKENKALLAVAEEHEQLKTSYADQNQR